MALDRRRFLKLSALGVIATVADSACDGSSDRAVAAADRPRLLSMFDAERVRELGNRYRASTPSESTATALREAIANGHGLRIPFARNASLDDEIRDDFAAGRTVLVDGWVLSRTEARQAALFSLKPA
jgi:hypothetical protein